MLEKIILKLIKLPPYDRLYIGRILGSEESFAICVMEYLKSHPVAFSSILLEACDAGLSAEFGKCRAEFLTDLLASLGMEEAVND